jgi:ribonuclease E
VRSHSSIALHVFRSIEDYLTKHPRFDLIVRCPTVIALDILNHKRSGLIDLEDRFGLKVTIHADTTLPGQSFLIEKGEAATGIPRKPQNYAAMDLPEDDDVAPEIEDEDDVVPARAEMPDEETDWQARDTGNGRSQNADRDNGGAREDRDGRKRRRRRKRGRRPEGALSGEPRGDVSTNPHDNADFYAGDDFAGDAVDGDYSGTEEGTQAESAGGSDERSDADGGRRRRRRGRRGGRRNRREDEAGFAAGDLPDGAAGSANDDLGEERFV